MNRGPVTAAELCGYPKLLAELHAFFLERQATPTSRAIRPVNVTPDPNFVEDEAEAAACDMAYERMKSSGGLVRAEQRRALDMQIHEQGVSRQFFNGGLV